MLSTPHRAGSIASLPRGYESWRHTGQETPCGRSISPTWRSSSAPSTSIGPTSTCRRKFCASRKPRRSRSSFVRDARFPRTFNRTRRAGRREVAASGSRLRPRVPAGWPACLRENPPRACRRGNAQGGPPAESCRTIPCTERMLYERDTLAVCSVLYVTTLHDAQKPPSFFVSPIGPPIA
jgi:hypothetical protein